MEQKLDTVAMVMGGLGLLEIQDDTHQEPKFKAAGLFLCVCIKHNTIFPSCGVMCAFFSLFEIIHSAGGTF